MYDFYKNKDKRSASVHLELFPSIPSGWNNPNLANKFEEIRKIRKVIMGALEVERKSKKIGSSLQAIVTVFLDEKIIPFIEGVDLAEISITSGVDVVTGPPLEGSFTLQDVPGVGAIVNVSTWSKCERCWKTAKEVIEPLNLCKRCEDFVKK